MAESVPQVGVDQSLKVMGGGAAVIPSPVLHDNQIRQLSMIGKTLGPYTVRDTLGEGGMGQVYRAHDSKLGREVALKVVSDSFALDPDRLARFRREAQVLASLNHPNIAQIYGFEDSGATHALVMELVEGPTLADRIEQGPVPL